MLAALWYMQLCSFFYFGRRIVLAIRSVLLIFHVGITLRVLISQLHGSQAFIVNLIVEWLLECSTHFQKLKYNL